MTRGFHCKKKQIYQYQVKSMRYKRAWKLTLQGIKIYEVDNTLGSKADNTVGREEWFDLDLSTRDLKINRDHLLIEGNPCAKFGIDQLKGSKDI